MAAQNLLFSIIIPVYKVNPIYLRKCIESTLKQKCTSYEVIIIDDGSPDDSGLICDEYARDNKLLRVIHKKNEGVSCARNDGICESLAQWILFLDADDWLEDNALESLERIVREHDDCDLIQFRTFQNYQHTRKLMDLSTEVNHCYVSSNSRDSLMLYRLTIQPSRYRKNSISRATAYFVWDKVYNRDFLVANNIRFVKGIKVSEDKLFYMRCLESFNKIMAVDEVLYNYRANENSVTHKYGSDLDNNRLQMLNELKKIIERITYGNSEYKIPLQQDYYDFCVVMASNVIINQYYHKDSPLTIGRKWSAASKYIQKEPFATALRKSKLNGLTSANKIRFVILKLKMFFLLYPLSNMNRILDGRSLSAISEDSE